LNLRAPSARSLATTALVARLQRGDQGAEEELLRSCAGLVHQLARKALPRATGMEIDDLVIEGQLGLLCAARRFDCSRGTAFSTFAVFWVRQSIVRAIQNAGGLVHIPVGLQDSAFRQPEGAALTERQAAALAMRTVCSLDFELLEDGERLGELLPAGADPAEEVVNQEWARQVLNSAGLSWKEQVVLEWRCGFRGGAVRTLAEIAAALDMSREGVRHAETRAVKKLQKVAVR
jgi:RNA polymerase sigma factor (sigma-70 family)